jgi:hypothetical protein
MQAHKLGSRLEPLSPRRYKLQVTLGQEARDALVELQNLLSHQIPDGDLAVLIERALKALLEKTKKRKAALEEAPRVTPPGKRKGKAASKSTRSHPAGEARTGAQWVRSDPAKIDP